MAAERDYSKRASWRVLKELVRPHWHMAVAACVLLLACSSSPRSLRLW